MKELFAEEDWKKAITINDDILLKNAKLRGEPLRDYVVRVLRAFKNFYSLRQMTAKDFNRIRANSSQ